MVAGGVVVISDAELRTLAWRTLPCRTCKEPAGRRCKDTSGDRIPPHPTRMVDIGNWLQGADSRQGEVDALTGQLLDRAADLEAADRAVTLLTAERDDLRIEAQRLASEVTGLTEQVATVTRDLEATTAEYAQHMATVHPEPEPTPVHRTLFGAGGGNLDRTNSGIQIDRWYGGHGDVDKAIAKAKANHAAGIKTWLSFKLPHSWAAMASGSGDTWARDLFAKLDALGFEVWVAFHHEPEGDGVTSDWRKMQDRLSRMVPGGIAGRIKFWLIVTGWHQEDGTTAAYKWDVLYPTGAPIYGIAYDYPYNQYGFEWANGTKTTTMNTVWREGAYWVDKLAARAKALSASEGREIRAAIAECGYSDEAFAKDKEWLDRFLAAADAANLEAVTYFDTPLNSVRSWYLGTSTSAKRTYFNQVLARFTAEA